MANLAKTDAQWLRFLRGTILVTLRRCREQYNLLRRYTRERTQIQSLGDFTSATPHITAITLSGVSYAVNTSDRGGLYVRFVANASNWDIHIYTAPAASGEVGTATNVAASATGSIVAANSSGLTGSLTLGATIAGDVSDNHELIVDVDWKLEGAMRWPSDGTYDDDASSQAAFTRANAAQAGAVRGMIARELQLLDELMIGAGDNPVAFGNFFLQGDENRNLVDVVSRSSTGVVSRIRQGLLPILFSAMTDEATGSTQDGVERVVDAQAAAFDSNNDGLGAVADHTPEEHCPIGTWYFTCIAGHNDGPEIAGNERFSVRFASADSDDTLGSADFRELTVGESYKGPDGFGAITLTRTIVKTSDASHVNIANSTITPVGENGFNTASGVLYVLVVDAGGSTFNFEFYSSSAGRSAGNAHGDLVARVTGIAAATATQATERNGSGLSVSFTTGSAPVDTNTADLDLNFFSSQNSSSAPDKFSIPTALTSAGLIQALMSLVLKFKIPSVVSSPQIPDDEARINVPLSYITVDV